jgi:hypothetical protein
LCPRVGLRFVEFVKGPAELKALRLRMAKRSRFQPMSVKEIRDPIDEGRPLP